MKKEIGIFQKNILLRKGALLFHRPDTQYRHTPDRDLNSRLNIVVALTLACVLGLGLGHFLGENLGIYYLMPRVIQITPVNYASVRKTSSYEQKV